MVQVGASRNSSFSSYLLKTIRPFFLRFSLAISLWGLVPLYGHDDKSPKKQAEEIGFFISGVLKELESFRTTQASKTNREYSFILSNGNRIEFSPSQLAEAMIRQIRKSAAEIDAHDHEHCGDCHHETHQEIKAASHTVAEKIQGYFLEMLRIAKEGGYLLPGSALRLSREYDIITLAAIAILWPVYTPISEVVESFFVGPFHVFCMAAQIFFFSAVGLANRAFVQASRAAFERSVPLSLKERFSFVLKSTIAAWKQRRAHSKIIGVGEGWSMSQKLFRNSNAKDLSEIERKISFSLFWADVWMAKFKPQLQTTIAQINDIQYLVASDPSDRFQRALEIVEGLDVLLNLLVDHSRNLQLSKQTPYKVYMNNQGHLGVLKKQLLSFRSTLLAAAISWDRAAAQKNIPLLQDIFDDYLLAIQELLNPATSPDQKKHRIKGIKMKLSTLRSGQHRKSSCQWLIEKLG